MFTLAELRNAPEDLGFPWFESMTFPSFHSKNYENASYFLDDLEMAFLASGRDQDEVKLRAFPLVMRDEAKVWFQGLAVEDKAD